MKKTLYLIGGTMGVGKTSVGIALNKTLPRSVFLDGDWCWYADPFVVNKETRMMVIENITSLLNNFIKCNAYENIILCWVMDRQEIVDMILSKINTSQLHIKTFSLMCSPSKLETRLTKDLEVGKRDKSIIQESISRLPNYNSVSSIKIDTSDMTINEIVEVIIN